jgi:hypothetical protein
MYTHIKQSETKRNEIEREKCKNGEWNGTQSIICWNLAPPIGRCATVECTALPGVACWHNRSVVAQVEWITAGWLAGGAHTGITHATQISRLSNSLHKAFLAHVAVGW